MTQFIKPQFDNIPLELRRLQKWVTWAAEGADGEKPRKVPYSPDRINTRASSTDPKTWGTFMQAEAAYLEGGLQGVGIMLDGDGLVGVDIDHCVTDGTPAPAALALLEKLGAGYVEVSPSGTGLRAFGYAGNLATGCKGKLDGLDVELYSTSRYLTLTGKTIKTGPISPLMGFVELADSIRADRRVNLSTGKVEKVPPDVHHTELMRRVLSGEVYHDSLRDLAASLVATGMKAGAVVNHLRSLMDACQAPQDKRWTARRGQIPALVGSAAAKFSPSDNFTGLTIDNAICEQLLPMLKPVSVFDVLTNPAPPPKFIWDGYLPRGVVSLLGAHGGTGKSTIALMLSVCAALGLPLFGVDTVQCKALFVSLEDSAYFVRHRLAFICSTLGINPAELDGKLHIVDGTENPELFSADHRGAGETTATYYEMLKLVQLEGVGLVVVDNASDAYGGDEIQRKQVRAFIRSLVMVARLRDSAVLLLAHVDKNTSRARKAEGGEGYSGSTAWHNSARSRLFMTRTESGTLSIEHQKSNLGRCHESLTLVWPQDGLPQVFDIESSNDPLNPFMKHMNGREDDERAITLLKMIAEFESRQQYCSPAITSRNHVHSVLKSESAFLKLKLRPDDTKRIINQCQRAKWIEPLDYRSPDRKQRQRWTLTSEGRLIAGLSAPTAPTAEDGAS